MVPFHGRGPRFGGFFFGFRRGIEPPNNRLDHRKGKAELNSFLVVVELNFQSQEQNTRSTRGAWQKAGIGFMADHGDFGSLQGGHTLTPFLEQESKGLI